MILGYGLLGLALAATIAASAVFTLSRRDGRSRLVRVARLLALAGAGAIVAASGYLIYLFATHQFQVAYVAEYSAKRSAAKYLFAAFWGGQEGSILLWTFWTALLGAVLAWRGGGREAKVWPIFGVVQAFLLVLLLLKSPFALGHGPVPADGRGLNPLLENPWMVIHPPILFLGFSSLAISYAWTLYGLLYRDWDGWVRRAFPWALFSFAALGFGVALGGYWAYETLGWGGFWGWDPVENSSLVPWLFLTALLHGTAIQRANGGYKVTNLLLGFLPFSFMFYGTFLTRTGVLEGFSVHTFSSLGTDGFWILLGAVVTTALVPLALIIARFQSIPKPPAYERVASREWGFFLASVLLGIVGVITAVGMSAPLLTRLWLEKGAAAQPEFYNRAAYPLAILMTVAMAATPYFAWRATNADGVLKRLFPAYAAAITLTLGMFLLGARDPWMLLLFATSAFAALTNLLLILPRLKRRESRRTVGGFVAHVGVGLALVGVACLVAFSQDKRVALVKNRPTEALGYKLTYLGMTSQPFDRSNSLRVKVEKDGRSWEANPRLYLAPWGGKDTLFANPPAIFPNIYSVASLGELLPWNNPYKWGDLYIAYFRGPLSTDPQSPNGGPSGGGMEMKAQDVRTYGDYKFKFWGIDFPDEVREAMKSGPDGLQKLSEIRVKALVDVWYQGQKTSVTPEIVMNHTGTYTVHAALPGAPNAIIMMDQFLPPQGAVLSTMNLPDASEAVILDFSTKPMIWTVWLGTLLYTLGGFVAYRRRALEMADAEDEAEEAPAPAPAPGKTGKREKRRKPMERPSPEPARATAAPRRR
jgi:cytochrome c-type biogenesis protein CcmF